MRACPVSRVCADLKVQFEQWSRRPLDRLWLDYVFLAPVTPSMALLKGKSQWIAAARSTRPSRFALASSLAIGRAPCRIGSA